MAREALFYEGGDGAVRCLTCARECVIREGRRGVCGVRENKGGKLYLLTYGLVSSCCVDPIEKKPLFHFWPGSYAYSIGTVGCNFKCKHCQNWHISQRSPEEVPMDSLPPDEAVKGAIGTGCRSIAYTYNEPIITLEYMLDMARAAREKGVLNVAVTNGYIRGRALEAMADAIDAANVDVKAFTERFYREVCGGVSLEPVLRCVEELKRREVHVEVTYLVIPGWNDSRDEVREFSRWVVGDVGADTPVHFSRFFPNYKMMDREPTPVETLLEARRIAEKEGCQFVYVGNVWSTDLESTRCPSCGTVVIRRVGYSITDVKLDEGNSCLKCGEEIPVVGEIRKSSRWSFWS